METADIIAAKMAMTAAVGATPKVIAPPVEEVLVDAGADDAPRDVTILVEDVI